MALIEMMIAETVASGSLWWGAKKVDERAQIRASLMEWDMSGKPTPVLDGYMERWSGTAETARERKISSMIIDTLRFIVGRKAFEHFVRGCVNGNSKIREKLPFLQKLMKFNKGGAIG